MNKKLIRLIALALIAVMTLSLCACSTGSAEEETTTTIAIVSGDPEGKAEVVARFNELMAATKAAKSVEEDEKNGFNEMKYWLDHDINDVESDNETIKSLIKLFADKATSNGYDLSTNNEEEPSNPKECFPLMGSDKAGALNLADVRSAVITDNGADSHYTIMIKINPETNPDQENSIYGKLYKITEDGEILKEFDGYKDFITVDGYDATYGIGTIKMVVDKKTDHVTKLELSREVNIETKVTGQGTLKNEIAADTAVTFKFNSTANYEISWPESEEAAE